MKGLFGILGFFQKTNEQIRFFCLTVLKTNLFVQFLEESEDSKKFFRNYLTLSGNRTSRGPPVHFFLYAKPTTQILNGIY